METLICWENLDIQRYVLKNHASNEDKILHLTPEQEKDKSHFTDKEVTNSFHSSSPYILESRFYIFCGGRQPRNYTIVLTSSSKLRSSCVHSGDLQFLVGSEQPILYTGHLSVLNISDVNV